MTRDLIEFYDNIIMLNKEVSIYEDKEGNYTILPTGSLFASVDYNELNKQQYEIAKFNGDIPKNFIPNKTKVKKAISKYEVTKKEEDRYTLVDKEEEVNQIWFVINNLKIRKAYLTKEEANEVAHKINDRVFKALDMKAK